MPPCHFPLLHPSPCPAVFTLPPGLGLQSLLLDAVLACFLPKWGARPGAFWIPCTVKTSASHLERGAEVTAPHGEDWSVQCPHWNETMACPSPAREETLLPDPGGRTVPPGKAHPPVCSPCSGNPQGLRSQSLPLLVLLEKLCMLSLFSHVRYFATLWTVAHQVPLSMGFSRQE